MAEQEKGFVVTPDMQKARGKLANMTPEEQEADRTAMLEELRRYYSGTLRPETIREIESIRPVEK